MQLSHFHLGACHRQKKEQRRFSFQPPHLSGSLPPQKRQEYPACSCHIFTWEPATAKKGKEGLVFNCHAHLGACHRKNVKHIQLAAVTFSLGSLPPQKKGQEGSAGSLPPQKNQEYPACSCHIFTWEPATAKKKGQEISVCNCHAHLGACHPKKGTNVQLASVAFSSGSLPPPKRQEYPVCSCHIFAWGPATAKKKVKKVSFQLSTTTVIWESATTKNEQMCSLQVYHLGACHQKNVKSRLQNRRWDRLELFFHTKED